MDLDLLDDIAAVAAVMLPAVMLLAAASLADDPTGGGPTSRAGPAGPHIDGETRMDREELIRLVLEDTELRKALAKALARAIEHDYPLRDAVQRAIKRERQLKAVSARESGTSRRLR